MNDHYTRAYNPPTGTRVSSSDLINEFQAVQGGFDSVQTDLENTLRQASGDPIAAIPNAVSRALKALAFDASGNPVAVEMVAVVNAVAKTGDTMLGPLIQPLSDKQTQVISVSGVVAASAGIRYVIAANDVTLTVPVGPEAGSFHGVVICNGVTGFVWNFGTTKLRGATAGMMSWDILPRAVDLHYQDAARGYV